MIDPRFLMPSIASRTRASTGSAPSGLPGRHATRGEDEDLLLRSDHGLELDPELFSVRERREDFRKRHRRAARDVLRFEEVLRHPSVLIVERRARLQEEVGDFLRQVLLGNARELFIVNDASLVEELGEEPLRPVAVAQETVESLAAETRTRDAHHREVLQRNLAGEMLSHEVGLLALEEDLAKGVLLAQGQGAHALLLELDFQEFEEFHA
jgi:hypothetical protein